MTGALREATARLAAAGVENAAQEARWMVELARREATPQERLEAMLRQREAGVPFQYAVGSTEFYCIELEVGPGVLIQRPETELLVEEALRLLKDAPAGTRVLDLCTGSAAIPLAMAAERPDLDYTAVDLSPEALAWARRNAARLKPPHLQLLQGDLFEPLAAGGQFALVTANPPYVSPSEYAALEPEIKEHEPRLALEAEDDGLAVACRILDEARPFMASGAFLLMEMGETQGRALQERALADGFSDVRILRDLTGRDRFVFAINP